MSKIAKFSSYPRVLKNIKDSERLQSGIDLMVRLCFPVKHLEGNRRTKEVGDLGNLIKQ
jgi:hypothetical protein